MSVVFDGVHLVIHLGICSTILLPSIRSVLSTLVSLQIQMNTSSTCEAVWQPTTFNLNHNNLMCGWQKSRICDWECVVCGNVSLCGTSSRMWSSLISSLMQTDSSAHSWIVSVFDHRQLWTSVNLLDSQLVWMSGEEVLSPLPVCRVGKYTCCGDKECISYRICTMLPLTITCRIFMWREHCCVLFDHPVSSNLINRNATDLIFVSNWKFGVTFRNNNWKILAFIGPMLTKIPNPFLWEKRPSTQIPEFAM